MQVLHVRDGHEARAHGLQIDARRDLLHEDARALAQGADGVEEDVGADADAEDRVHDGPAGEVDEDAAHEHGGPAEHILEQVQVSAALVEGFAAVEPPRREAVHGEAEEGEADHAQ